MSMNMNREKMEAEILRLRKRLKESEEQRMILYHSLGDILHYDGFILPNLEMRKIAKEALYGSDDEG